MILIQVAGGGPVVYFTFQQIDLFRTWRTLTIDNNNGPFVYCVLDTRLTGLMQPGRAAEVLAVDRLLEGCSGGGAPSKQADSSLERHW